MPAQTVYTKIRVYTVYHSVCIIFGHFLLYTLKALNVDYNKYLGCPKIKENKKLAASKAYSIPPAMCRSKPCKFVKNYFFSIKLLHAHLQYVCNIPAKYQMNILKALGGVDFTKYALLPISQYVHWKKIG